MSKSDTARNSESHRPRASVTILWIGLVAGTLDITDNLIFNHLRGITPTMVFQYIAAGLIGMRSVDLGAASVALGVVLHYFIAISWTAIFYLAARRLEILRRRPVISGLAYGASVYLFMNLIVVPLSNVPHVRSTVTLANRINGVLAVVIFIGLTISLLTSASIKSGSAW
jgi:hypothetical protein